MIEVREQIFMLQRIEWNLIPSSFGFFLGGCPIGGKARPHRTHVELFARVNVGGDKRQLLGSVLENALLEPVVKHLGKAVLVLGFRQFEAPFVQLLNQLDRLVCLLLYRPLVLDIRLSLVRRNDSLVVASFHVANWIEGVVEDKVGSLVWPTASF